MKQLFYLFLFVPGQLYCQAEYYFEDSLTADWVQVPENRWGISNGFILSGSSSLHHEYDSPTAAADLIGINSMYPDTSQLISYSFLVKHGYNPSSGNNWQCFMLADSIAEFGAGSPVTSAVVFGVNFTGADDTLKLWQVSEGISSLICSTTLNYQEDIGTTMNAGFRISRQPGGNWHIEYASSGNPDSLIRIGNGKEIQSSLGRYTGFRYSYSSAQDRKLWIDDLIITGSFYLDTLPPMVKQVVVNGLDKIQLEFNEKVRLSTGSRFSWKGDNADIEKHEADWVELRFSKEFPNRTYQDLYISGVTDSDGNRIRDTLVRFRMEMAEFGDVVISEIMADPNPVVYLPECEYIELFNRSEFRADLAGWIIRVNEKNYEMPLVYLHPGEYLLLIPEESVRQFSEVNSFGVANSGSLLPNSGGMIQLLDRYGRLIHLVEYREPSSYDATRMEGGWAYEAADLDYLCGGLENWHLSEHWRGGTPGKENSLRETIFDLEGPVLTCIGLPSDSSLIMVFDEMVYLDDERELSLFPEGNLNALTARIWPDVSRQVELIAGEPLKVGTMYHLFLDRIQDCSGNTSGEIELFFSLPERPAPFHPVLNEIMYDPFAGYQEYIELFNPGDSYLDLADLKISIDNSGEHSGRAYQISTVSHLFPPGHFIVLCKDGDALRREWSLGREVDVVEPESWISLPDRGGCIVLTDRGGRTIDMMCFNDSMHNALLSVTSGISLEKLDPLCLNSPGPCWNSASSSLQYGTPGAINSRIMQEPEGESGISLSPRVFSPDNDGVEDILLIEIAGAERDSFIDIMITDMTGGTVRRIIHGGYLGNNDRFFWEGKNDSGKIVVPGIYVVHFNIYGKERVKYTREPCAVKYN